MGLKTQFCLHWFERTDFVCVLDPTQIFLCVGLKTQFPPAFWIQLVFLRYPENAGFLCVLDPTHIFLRWHKNAAFCVLDKR